MLSLSSPDTSPSRCKEIGKLKYYRSEILGRGTFGFVYKGEFNGEKVAVKRMIVLDDRYTRLASVIEAELRLIHFGKEMWHEHLVRYLHKEEDDYFLYIAMELCAGTLEDLVQNDLADVPAPTPNEEILRQITAGIQFLHANQIVHRDIKPKNILISHGGVVKLSDFGLSNQKDEDATSFSFVGMTGGTHGWAAPELLATDTMKFKFAVDVFSLGCVFCYVLTDGRHLFGHDKIERMMNIKKAEIDMDTLNLIENNKLRELTKKMVSMRPEHRPSLNLIQLTLMECLLKIYVMNLAEKGDEFNKTIDRIAKIYTAEEPTIDWIREDMLSSIGKSNSKYKFKCVGKVLEASDVLRIDMSSKANRINACTAFIIDKTVGNEADMLGELTKVVNAEKDNANKSGDNSVTIKSQNKRQVNNLSVLSMIPFLKKPAVFLLVVLVALLAIIYQVTITQQYERKLEIKKSEANNSAALIATQCQSQRENMKTIIEVFINNGADVKWKTSDNWNALMVLCRYFEHAEGLLPLVKKLIQNGVNVNEKNSDGWTALQLLTRNFGNNRNEPLSDVVRILLESGAEADVRTNNGWTPLHFSCKYYQREDLIDVIRLHIKHGANPDHRLPSGDNVLNLAAQFQTQQENLVEIIEILIDGGADVNCKDPYNWNAFMNLCRFYENPKGLLPAVKLLVQKGMDVNEKQKDGWTALHFVARYFGNNRIERLSDIVKILLEAGAEAHVTTVDGWTPLHIVGQFYQREDLNQVIQLLIKHGAKADHKDPNGIDARALVTKYYTLENKADVLALLLPTPSTQ